ncbi:hypothetical protein M3J09_006190 [Ascochyta lentis]
MCQAWTCIVSENKDLQPPISFYDRDLSEDGTRFFKYPRSASSLLRKATYLHPPFCFLQHDQHDDATDVRNMLCAIILYPSLLLGVDDRALAWAKFEQSLSQALRYIDSRAAYHQWLHDPTITTLQPEVSGETSRSSAPEDRQEAVNPVDSEARAVEEPRAISSVNDDKHIASTLQIDGSNMVVKPNTSLWRLKSLIGHARFQLLQNIPPGPMKLSPHTFGSRYFPLCLQIGTHNQGSSGVLGVYACLIHEGPKKTTMKIMSHQDDLHKSWAMEKLQDVDLLEPFNYLNKLTTKSNGAMPGSKARAAKIRSVISYYFFVAENEGLIGDPRINVGKAFGKRLCAACVELQQAKLDNNAGGGHNRDHSEDDDDTDIEDMTAAPIDPMDVFTEELAKLAREKEGEGRPSSIVTFRLQPNILRDITNSGPLKHRDEVPDSDSEPEMSHSEPRELASEEPLSQNLPRRQLELCTSSQISREVSQSSSTSSGDEIEGTPISVAEMEALRPGVIDSEHTRKSNTTVGLNEVQAQRQPVAVAQMDQTIAVDREGPSLPLDSRQVVGDGPLSIEKLFVVAARVHDSAKIALISSANSSLEQPLSKDTWNESDDRSVSMDMSSPLSPGFIRLHSPAIQSNGARTGPESVESVANDTDVRIDVDQDISRKTATPERTAERDMEEPPASSTVNQLGIVSNASQTIEISDDENLENTAPSVVQNEIERTPEAIIGEQNDVSQLPSRPGGAKRSSIFIPESDSDLEMIVEQKRAKKKRKMKLSDEGKAEHLTADHATRTSSETTREAATGRMVDPSRLGEELHGKDGHVKSNGGLFLKQPSKAKDRAEPIPKASTQTREEIDLTQECHNPQGHKRTSVTLFVDSDDDIIEEVDNSEWRRAFRNRR